MHWKHIRQRMYSTPVCFYSENNVSLGIALARDLRPWFLYVQQPILLKHKSTSSVFETEKALKRLESHYLSFYQLT